jgi:hypothetical protein
VKKTLAVLLRRVLQFLVESRRGDDNDNDNRSEQKKVKLAISNRLAFLICREISSFNLDFVALSANTVCSNAVHVDLECEFPEWNRNCIVIM